MILEKILLGVSLAAPIGPVSVEVIRRGLAHGFIAAFMICVGATMGDGIFLISAYFGLNTIASNPIIISVLGLVGASLLFYIGIGSIKNRNKLNSLSKASDKKGVFSSILLRFSLALINPMSLVFWVGIFAASMASSDDKSFLPNLLILAGVLLWSFTLSSIVATSKHLLNKKVISYISIFSGILLISYGARFGYNALKTIISALL